MPQYPYSPVNTNLGALATLTAAATSGATTVQTNSQHTGIQVGINVTAITGTSPTLVVTVQGVDPVSATAFTVLASASITATGYTVLTVRPGITETTNVSASAVLPYNWKVSYTIGGTTPAVTATISAVALV